MRKETPHLITRPFSCLFFFVDRIVFSMSSNNKIFQSVVRSVFIYMVDKFMCFKNATNLLFHYKAMFRYISFLIRFRMRWFMNPNIPMLFDTVTFRARSRSVWSFDANKIFPDRANSVFVLSKAAFIAKQISVVSSKEWIFTPFAFFLNPSLKSFFRLAFRHSSYGLSPFAVRPFNYSVFFCINNFHWSII